MVRLFRFLIKFPETDVEPEEETPETSPALLGPKLNYKPQREVENITVCMEVERRSIPVTRS